MDLQAAVKESLQFLYDGYKNYGGTGQFSIDEIVKKYGIPSHEFGELLLQNGWIKNQNFGPYGFSCSISKAGINYIDPNYFNDLISKALITAGITNDWVGLMETIPFEPKDFQRAHDLGKVLKSTDLAEVQFQADEVYIKLTLLGQDRYQRENEGGFFS